MNSVTMTSENKIRSILTQPGTAARVPKSKTTTPENAPPRERFRRPSDEARNTTLEAKRKGHEWSVAIEHGNKQTHDRETHGIELSECAMAIAATVVCLMTNPRCSHWKDKAPALNFPKPEPKSSRGRNAAVLLAHPVTTPSAVADLFLRQRFAALRLPMTQGFEHQFERMQYWPHEQSGQ
jgi:hypothetical protein